MVTQASFSDQNLTTDFDDDEGEFSLVSDTLYFISDGEFIKIGRTGNVVNRLRTLQNANPKKLVLIKALDNSGWEGPVWHYAFKQYRAQGEWFHVQDPLLQAIHEAEEGDDGWCYFAPRPEIAPIEIFPELSGDELWRARATFCEGDHQMWGDWLAIRRERLMSKLFN